MGFKKKAGNQPRPFVSYDLMLFTFEFGITWPYGTLRQLCR